MDSEATLRAKVATLRGEVRKLRRVASVSREDALLERTQTDALQLLVWRFSGLSVSRRNAEEMGMTQRRWQWARALLELAHIHDGHDVTAADFEEAIQALDRTVHSLCYAGLETLKVRLPTFVLLANARAKAPAKLSANAAANGVAQKTFINEPPVERRAAVGGVASRGSGRDRRAEIEHRMQAMEAQR